MIKCIHLEKRNNIDGNEQNLKEKKSIFAEELLYLEFLLLIHVRRIECGS